MEEKIQRERFTLPNGKEVVVFTGLTGQKVGWQRYPDTGQPWEPFDPKLLEFTPADKLVGKGGK